jgi:hypothetical protein
MTPLMRSKTGPSRRQPGDLSDQIPESLLPAVACASRLHLTPLDIIAATTIFFIGEITLSESPL